MQLVVNTLAVVTDKMVHPHGDNDNLVNIATGECASREVTNDMTRVRKLVMRH